MITEEEMEARVLMEEGQAMGEIISENSHLVKRYKLNHILTQACVPHSCPAVQNEVVNTKVLSSTEVLH